MRRKRFILPLLLCAALASGQSPSPSFEVVSIKPGGKGISTRPAVTAGRLNWTTSLAYLIGFAHGMDNSRVSAKQKNIGSAYAIEATFDPKATEADLQTMMRTMLIERFKLRARVVRAESEGYALTPAKGNRKGVEPKADQGGESVIFATTPNGVISVITARNATMTQLAETLQRSLRTPVWDQTGRSGRYDFELKYTGNPDSSTSVDAPWVGTALLDVLGVSLEKKKGPVDTVVVDSVEEPTEN